jgi:hypothetical protein
MSHFETSGQGERPPQNMSAQLTGDAMRFVEEVEHERKLKI